MFRLFVTFIAVASMVIVGCETAKKVKETAASTTMAAVSSVGSVTTGMTGLFKEDMEPKNKDVCSGHLGAIGFATLGYADAHKDAYPFDAKDPSGAAALKALVADRGITASDLQCPSAKPAGEAKTKGADQVDYEGFTRQFGIVTPADAPIAWDKTANHKDGRHVLLASGKVTWMSEADFQKALATAK